MKPDWLDLARPALVGAVLLTACTPSAAPTHQPAPRPRVVATISGEVDAVAGTLSLGARARSLSAPATGAYVPAALVDIPVEQDGVPGQGSVNTVELVTERAGTVAAGCGAVDGFEGDIRLRSFYAGYELRNAYVEIVSITPTGREACNSAPAVDGVSDQYGLFAYGTLAGTGASAVATWRFRLPDATRFTFTGRVVADLVDATPPTTTATPPGNVFGAPQTVTLACADAGSGCAATYYTLDGSAPTTTSPLYAGPIAVTSTGTIRYFSVDAAGNAEAPQAQTYVIDTVAPTVVAVTPRPQQGNVPESLVVQVEFSEPLDPATVQGALSVAGPAGPLAGTIAPLDGLRWTFTPGAPLPAATTFSVQVGAGARDLAGNALVPFTSRFSTTTPATPVSGAGSATYRAWSVAYDAQGNGVALFATNSSSSYRGGKLLYAYYDAAAGAWGAERALATLGTTGLLLLPAKVVSNGTTFLALWQETDGAIRSVLFTSGAPSAVVTLAAGNLTYPPATFDVASNGTGYAATFIEGAKLKAWTHDGSAWDALGPTILSSTLSASNPVIAQRGASYAVAYREGNYDLYASRYDGASRTWTATQLTATGATAYVIGPTIASNGSTVTVGWGTTTGPVMAAMDPGTGFGTAVNVSNGYGDKPYALAAAANGSRFALAWYDRPTAGAASGYGAVFDGTTWTGSSLLEYRTGAVTGIAVAPSGAGFAAALEISDSTTLTTPASIWVNQTTSGGYWSAVNQFSVEPDSAHAAHPVLVQRGTGVVVGWDQDDAARHQVRLRTFDGATLGATVGIASPGQAGASNAVRLTANAAGEVAAVWTQDDRGGPAVFAAVRSAGAWGAPVRIALSATAPAIASNGQGFLIAYLERRADGTASGARAVPFTGGVAGASTLLESGDASAPAVASDGSGYLVAWRLGTTSARAAIYAGTSWSAPATVNVSGSAYAPQVTGRPGAYLVAWRDSASALVTRRATAAAPAGPWTWDAPVTVASSVAPTMQFAVAANPAAFAITWSDPMSYQGGAYAAVHTGTWQPRVTLVSSPPYCDLAQIAGSSDGFLAVVNCTSGLRASRYAGSAWSAPGTVGAASTALALSSDGQGYKILARQADGSGTSLYAIDVTPDGTAWPGQLMASGTAPVPAPIQPVLSATFDGIQHVGAWIQQGADPAVDVVRSRAAY